MGREKEMSKGAFRLGARVVALTLAAMVIAPVGASANTNPWTAPADQFLNMAHQGGELEAPGNTLYAFKTAMRERGADSLEMDSYITLDGELVISHDNTLEGTTNFGTPSAPPPFDAPGASNKIWDYTLADLKKLDDSYWYSPGKGQYGHDESDPHPYRGMADGTVDPPAGYTANDFKIPTFREVLEAFPTTRINIDMKDQSGFTAKGIEAAHELAQILSGQPGGDNENVLVASFGQAEMEAFHADLPEHDSLSASLAATSGYALNNEVIQPAPQALQPPDVYEISGTLIDAPSLLLTIDESRGNDYAMHVWGADATPEDDALYQHLLDIGAQGFFAQKPSELAAFLCEKGVPRPDGSSHCTPNPDLPGIGPILKPADPQTTKAKVESGEKVVVEFGIENSGNLDLNGAQACATATGKAARWIKPGRCGKPGSVSPGSTLTARIPIRAKRKAKGAYGVSIAITSADGGSAESELTLRVKNEKKHGAN
jgi:glycerophosphoryl diester phosphodiesterase